MSGQQHIKVMYPNKIFIMKAKYVKYTIKLKSKKR